MEKQLARDISSKRNELERLNSQMAELTLFEEDKESIRIDQAKLAEEDEADRAACKEMIAFLDQENERLLKHVIPNRFELPEHVLAYPVAVEIRFREVAR